MGWWETLLDFAELHVRLFQAIAAVVSILIGGCGFLIGRYFRFRDEQRRRQAHNRLENHGVVVFEAHNLIMNPIGSIDLKVVSWGGKYTLSQLFHDPLLEAKIRETASRREGFLTLPQPSHKLMMIGMSEAIDGNDYERNVAHIKGRERTYDDVLVCPVTWSGTREAHLIRVIIIDPDWMEILAQPSVVERIRTSDPRHVRRSKWLHDIAIRWQTEQHVPWETACIWKVSL